MKLGRALAALVLSAGAVAAAATSCSLRNQEGPLVTCRDLECGRINACEDGIIAQCVDGKTVRYHACLNDQACDEEWQIAGQYRCTSSETDCEGCRPERVEGCGFGAGGAGGGGNAGAGGD